MFFVVFDFLFIDNCQPPSNINKKKEGGGRKGGKEKTILWFVF